VSFAVSAAARDYAVATCQVAAYISDRTVALDGLVVEDVLESAFHLGIGRDIEVLEAVHATSRPLHIRHIVRKIDHILLDPDIVGHNHHTALDTARRTHSAEGLVVGAGRSKVVAAVHMRRWHCKPCCSPSQWMIKLGMSPLLDNAASTGEEVQRERTTLVLLKRRTVGRSRTQASNKELNSSSAELLRLCKDS
jgi:hypothetical protein